MGEVSDEPWPEMHSHAIVSHLVHNIVTNAPSRKDARISLSLFMHILYKYTSTFRHTFPLRLQPLHPSYFRSLISLLLIPYGRSTAFLILQVLPTSHFAERGSTMVSCLQNRRLVCEMLSSIFRDFYRPLDVSRCESCCVDPYYLAKPILTH
jgi:hypothetical protein